MENLDGRPKVPIFASVFHGIRFKVKRLFVVMTSNFFIYLYECLIVEERGRTFLKFTARFVGLRMLRGKGG